MGYTHYWSIDEQDSIPLPAQHELRQILDQAYKQHIIQLEWDVNQPPLISNRKVVFNGVGEDGHETFSFDLDDDYYSEGGKRFAFCKTNMKPYDEYVMKTLLVLKLFMPNAFSFSSDGSFDEEWCEARRWCEEHFGVTTDLHQELRVG